MGDNPKASPFYNRATDLFPQELLTEFLYLQIGWACPITSYN